MTPEQLKKEKQEILTLIEFDKIHFVFEKIDLFLVKYNCTEWQEDKVVLKNLFSNYQNQFVSGKKVEPEIKNRVTLGLTQLMNDASSLAIQRLNLSTAVAADSQKDNDIQTLRSKTKALVESKLSDIVIPKNYQVEVSEEFQFSFCYPQNWAFDRFPQTVQYGYILDPNESGHFQTNMNVVIEDISKIQYSVEDHYQMGINALVAHLNGSQVLHSESFLFKGLSAIRSIVNHHTHGYPLTLYQVSVADHAGTTMYHISFTCLQTKFEENQLLFENITSTLRF